MPSSSTHFLKFFLIKSSIYSPFTNARQFSLMQEAVQLDDSWRQRVKPGVVEKLEKCADDPDFTNAQTFRDQCFHIFTHYPEISNYRRGTFGWDGTFDVGYDRRLSQI